ncbi:MAG: hypothetical protein ACREKB_09820, partial [Candidatus Rokuibacteriota bacterium]
MRFHPCTDLTRTDFRLADRLLDLAQRLPHGASLTLTRDGLLELATVDGARSDQPGPQADFT